MERKEWAGMSVLYVAFLIGGLFLLLLSVFSSYSLLSSLVGSSFPNLGTQTITEISVSLLSIVVNIGLTGALIFIYRDIRKAETDQTELIESQESILREQQQLRMAKNRPDITSKVSDSPSNDLVTVSCYNEGAGQAKNISFEIEMFVSQSDLSPIEAYEGHQFVPLQEVGESWEEDTRHGRLTINKGYSAEISSVRYDDKETSHLAKLASVEPNEERFFELKIRGARYKGVFADPGEARPISISRLTSDLYEDGYSALGWSIKYEYFDLLDNSVDTGITASGVVRLSPDMDFEDIYRDSSGAMSSLSAFNNEIHEPFFRY